MFNMRQAFQMAKWARHPPSAQRIKLMIAVLMICVVLFGIDRIFGWPDFLTMQNAPRGRF